MVSKIIHKSATEARDEQQVMSWFVDFLSTAMGICKNKIFGKVNYLAVGNAWYYWFFTTVFLPSIIDVLEQRRKENGEEYHRFSDLYQVQINHSRAGDYMELLLGYAMTCGKGRFTEGVLHLYTEWLHTELTDQSPQALQNRCFGPGTHRFF